MLAAIDSWIFVLLVGMAALLRLLATKTGSPKNPPDSSQPRPTSTPAHPPAAPRPAPQSDEEQIRRFLEALGQAPGSKPPPPVVHRTEVAPRPLAPVQPPRTFLPTPVPTRRKVVTPQPSEEWLRKINKPGQPVASVRAPATFSPTTPEPEAYEVRREPTGSLPEPSRPKTPAEAYAVATGKTVVADHAMTDLKTLLASPSGLRHAIILREIFGPPRSLQPLSETVGF